MKYCLLVIDLMNEIIHEKGKSPSCAAYVKEHHVIQKANQAIKIARHHELLILFVKVGFNSEYHELPRHSPLFGKAAGYGAFKIGEWGTEFHEALDYDHNDITLIKPRVSVFYGTPLEAFLRSNKIESIFLSGVSTNNAIQATARDAHDRDYSVIILDDACGAKNKEYHDNTLILLNDIATIITVDQMDTVLK